MSTGIELIPIFIGLAAATGIKISLAGLIKGASLAGEKLAEKQYPKQPLLELKPNISLQYDDAKAGAGPAAGDAVEEEVNAEELFGDFQRDRAAITLTTVMNNEEMLLGALLDRGLEHTDDEGVITAEYAECRLVFSKDENGLYQAKITGAAGMEEAERLCFEILELYLRRGQQRVYDNIMARAGHNGLALETEEVAEDNSIVLTFVVKGKRQ